MKIMKLYLALIVMTMVCITTFSACGSDDDDEKIENINNREIIIGTHQIDLSLEGETTGWDIETSFCATVPIYENGKELERSEFGIWESDEIRNYSITTDDKADNLVVGLFVERKGSVELQPVTVCLKSTVNGKAWKSKTIVLDGKKVKFAIITWNSLGEGTETFK